jgi:hypothetical protein
MLMRAALEWLEGAPEAVRSVGAYAVALLVERFDVVVPALCTCDRQRRLRGPPV